ncbi:MAG: AmmeMemoRadiSam system protein B [Bacteroidota bacterium]
MGKDDRRCTVCGQFYPADPQELRQSISEMIAGVKPLKLDGTVRGIIGPHAGYMYSGYTAAHAYALLQGKTYDCVVIVSPSHREYFDGVSVFPGGSYSTPLGGVEVDRALREKLLKNSAVVTASHSGHGLEHAIEVHLPFLQYVLGDFKLLPIVMGDQRRENCFALGDALGEVLKDENVLLVASTDLSHYYPSDVANRLDAMIIEDVKKFDYESLMRDIELQRAEACGGGPTVSVMLTLSRLGVKKMTILHHCNSGDVTGDHSQVVGYLAAAAYA